MAAVLTYISFYGLPSIVFRELFCVLVELYSVLVQLSCSGHLLSELATLVGIVKINFYTRLKMLHNNSFYCSIKFTNMDHLG